MTTDERGNLETSEERQITEYNPYSPGQPGEWDNSMPDVPAMEQLPDPDALPDPGYPVMPAPEPPAPELVTPELVTPEREQATGAAEAPRVPLPADGPGSASWPHPPAWPARPPGPSPAPAQPYQPAHPQQPAQAEAAPSGPPSWPASPGPAYAAEREPDAAPPLRGPSVPWAQVRASADYEAAEEPLAAPPSLQAPPTAGYPGFAPEQAGPASGYEAGPVPSADAGLRPTSDALTSDVLLPGKRATPDGGWRRTVFRATGGLIRVGDSSATVQRRDLVNRIRTPVAGGHHRVAVLSLKGGVGKTTATVGLGATLASQRGDRVIAVDGNPDRGTLSDKVRLETSATIRDLLNKRAMVGRYADVRNFTSQAPSRLEFLASDRDPGVSVAFSADDYRAVAGVLEHYYSICITDCGTGLLHSAMAGILELADQIVLVSSPSVDGARSASATLDWLDAHSYGDLVRNGVVVLSAVRRKSRSGVDLDRLEQHFAARCRAVVRVPYDTHLEEGAEFELDYLDPETAEAYLTLAALVADGFSTPRRPVSPAARSAPFA
jgi:MinD-like ATPase involved in chromosome partitioning or flagellar assembly